MKEHKMKEHHEHHKHHEMKEGHKMHKKGHHSKGKMALKAKIASK